MIPASKEILIGMALPEALRPMQQLFPRLAAWDPQQAVRLGPPLLGAGLTPTGATPDPVRCDGPRHPPPPPAPPTRARRAHHLGEPAHGLHGTLEAQPPRLRLMAFGCPGHQRTH